MSSVHWRLEKVRRDGGGGDPIDVQRPWHDLFPIDAPGGQTIPSRVDAVVLTAKRG